jgi:NhaP-type Na+/H+ or K+/H+ antiporter
LLFIEGTSMNKKKIFKKVMSIASLGVIGSAIGIATTSCGSSGPVPTPSPTPPTPIYDYVGNDTGTN